MSEEKSPFEQWFDTKTDAAIWRHPYAAEEGWDAGYEAGYAAAKAQLSAPAPSDAPKLTPCRHCGFRVALNEAPAISDDAPSERQPDERDMPPTAPASYWYTGKWADK